jgi:hypothetical protein
MPRRGVVTPIFVPGAFDDGATVGTVVTCERDEGDRVAVGEVLVQLRAGRVQASVESPLYGTLSRLYLRPGEPVHVGEILAEIREEVARGDGQGHSTSAGMLVDRAPGLLALVLAAGALVWPVTWLVLTVVALAVAGGITRARLGGGRYGTADFLVVPLRVLGGIVSWLGSQLRMLVPGLIGLLACIAAAIVVPALVGALTWLLSEGGDGALAAARLAVFEYGLRLFAFLVCAWLLRRTLRSGAPARWIRRVAAGAPELALTAAAVLGAAWILMCAVVISPRPWWPSGSFAEFAARMPDPLADRVVDVRRSWVQARALAVTRCLAEHGRGGWRDPRAFAREDGSLLVGVRAEPRAGERRVATLMLALNNQLAPHGVTVDVVASRDAPAISFVPDAGARPVRDFSAIGASAAANERDLQVALACSAATL